MTYTEVTNLIVYTINKVNSAKTSYNINRTIYRKSFKKRLARVDELLSELCIGYWKIYTKDLRMLLIEYDDEDTGRENLYPCTFFNLLKDNSYEEFKSIFSRSLLGCAGTIKGIASVADFTRDVLSMLSLIEALITEDLYKELSQIHNEQLDEVEALDKEIEAILPEMYKYSDILSELQELAAQKWFEEGEIKPGVRVLIHSSASTSKPFSGVVRSINGETLSILNDKTQEIESCTLSDVDKEKTWLLNNAQFRDLSAVVDLPR